MIQIISVVEADMALFFILIAKLAAAEGVTLKNRNRWKKQEWSLGEQIGWYLWEHTSWHYFRQAVHF